MWTPEQPVKFNPQDLVRGVINAANSVGQLGDQFDSTIEKGLNNFGCQDMNCLEDLGSAAKSALDLPSTRDDIANNTLTGTDAWNSTDVVRWPVELFLENDDATNIGQAVLKDINEGFGVDTKFVEEAMNADRVAHVVNAFEGEFIETANNIEENNDDIDLHPGFLGRAWSNFWSGFTGN